MSTLFDNAYPRTETATNKNENSKWATGRRYAVMNSLISTLGKVAAMRDIPVLIMNQIVTRYRQNRSALLVPAMAGMEWDNGIATRLVLFRDWPPDPGRLADLHLNDEKRRSIRYVGVVKIAGVGVSEAHGLGAIVPFTIENVSLIRLVARSRLTPQSGLSDVNLKTEEVPIETLTSPARPPKRTYEEVADSEDEPGSDEEYGWVEEDEVATEGLIDEAVLARGLSEGGAEQPPQKKRALEKEPSPEA